MYKEQVLHLLDELRSVIVSLGYVGGISEYPRIEVYDSSSGQQIDKGDNSKVVSVVWDVITECQNRGEALSISEQLQDYLDSNPISVNNFNVDMVTTTGTTGLEEEASSDNRTINRVLINQDYTLTQI